jgi:hypothetical protein
MAGPGRRAEAELLQALLPVAAAWQQVLAEQPIVREKQPMRLVHPQDDRVVLDDWLVGQRAASAHAPPVWIELQASKVADAGTRSPVRSRVRTSSSQLGCAAWPRPLVAVQRMASSSAKVRWCA